MAERNGSTSRARKLGKIMTKIGVFIAQDTSYGPVEDRARGLLMDALNRLDQAQHLLQTEDRQGSGVQQLDFTTISAPVES